MVQTDSTTEQEKCQLTPEQEAILQQLIDAGHDAVEATGWVLAEVSATADGPPRFAVMDMSSANWALKKIAELEDKQRQIERMGDAERDAITKRMNTLLSPIDKAIEFFVTVYGPQLEAWARAEIGSGKKRSVNLLHGTVGFRKGQDKLVVDDEDAMISVARTQGWDDCLKFSLLKAPLMNRLTDQPDWLQGLIGIAHIEPAEDKFYSKAELPLSKTATPGHDFEEEM